MIRPEKIWLNIDCCGLFTAVVTYNLMLLGAIGALQLLDLQRISDVVLFFILLSFLFLAGISHMRCMLTDPGAVTPLPKEISLEEIPPGEFRLRNGEYVSTCRKCHTYKPERAHHCSVCGRCIRNMDHHCPLYIFSSAIAQLSILVHFIMNCDSTDDSTKPLVVLGCFFEALMFGLFTLIMTCDQQISSTIAPLIHLNTVQVYNIVNDTSTIDRLKGGKSQFAPQTRMEKLEFVFGSEPQWSWLLPVEGSERRRRRHRYQHEEHIV
eukprot:gene8532-979_t